MKTIRLHGKSILCGEGSLSALKDVSFHRAILFTGGSSMEKTGVLDRCRSYLEGPGHEMLVYSGIGQNPTTVEVEAALAKTREFHPDLILAVGGGSAIDAAKAILLFYDHPKLNFENVLNRPLPQVRTGTQLIAIPSTSGTASEVTHVTVITYPEKKQKFAIKTEYLRPDLAILDGEIPVTMPAHIAAETGMDALTHALECYVNKNGDTFTDALSREAILGILRWLPISCRENTLEARQKMHELSCMAGMAFSNAGLGMVHGVSHAFSGMFGLPHGLANAVILPYSMKYNRRDLFVAEKYESLSRMIGKDIVESVENLRDTLDIPSNLQKTGIEPSRFHAGFEELCKNAMMGSTAVNPIPVSPGDMAQFISWVYLGGDMPENIQKL